MSYLHDTGWKNPRKGEDFRLTMVYGNALTSDILPVNAVYDRVCRISGEFVLTIA